MKALSLKKDSSYLNDKIVQHDQDIEQRIDILDKLIGGYH